MKCYAFIFARKGSKRLKNKNLKILNKKPLISYSIDLSKKIKNISKVFVSTNDPKIKKIALKKKCIIINRPNHLCSSSSPEWLSWQHAIRFVKKKFDSKFNFLSLPTTSPLRSKNDVIRCIKSLNNNCDIVLTISKTNLDPNFNMVYSKGKKILPFKNNKKKLMKRKKKYNVFAITTVAYAAKINFIMKNKSMYDGKIKYIKIPQHRALDIDTEYEYKVAKKFV